jgi:hypothetical protein
LQRVQLDEVLNIELGSVQQRVLETAKGQFLFRVTPAGRDFLLREGTDQRYGARHLKRAIERHVVYPLANLLATEQVHLGDMVRIDWNGEQNGLTFVRESEGALVPAGDEAAETKAVAVDLKDGKTVETPSEAVAKTKEARAALPAAAQAPAGAPQAKKKPEKS